MKADSACYSKGKDDWETPSWLFDLLDDEFGFIVDAAADGNNAKKCLAITCNSIETDWVRIYGKVAFWLNPPYSQWQRFIKKAYDESQKGATVVCLIPSRTDTVAWHELVMKADEIRFVRRRVNFVGGKSSAPFPSAVVIFRPYNQSKTPKVSAIVSPTHRKLKQNV
jgi:phage N-6-adenine-methyltransferase